MADVLAPLVAGMTATRARLLAWVHAQGVVALREVCAAEAAARAGPKGQHHAERTQHHWETTATELTLGGRRSQVARPRVRSPAGTDAVVPSGAAWRPRDPLTARGVQQIVRGVSTRGYAGSLEAGPEEVRTRGTSTRAVSRTVRGRMTAALETQLSQRLEALELLADAAASLREGLDDTLTVLTLGLPLRRRQCFATTHGIENLIGRVSRDAMSRRFAATGSAQDGSGAILRRGAALSVSPQRPRFGDHGDRSQCIELSCGPPRSVKFNSVRDNSHKSPEKTYDY